MAEEMIDWQATMFQPIGGMDQIPMAFGKKLGSVVRYGADVSEIRRERRERHLSRPQKRQERDR